MQPVTFAQDHQQVPPSARNVGRQREAETLRQACSEFEGFFISLMLKEGFKPVLADNPDAAAGQETMLEVALEQTGRDMGRQGTLGLADLLYDQLQDGL